MSGRGDTNRRFDRKACARSRAVGSAVLAFAALLLVPAAALAAGGGGHGESSGASPIPWGDMAEAIVNFGIFAFLLIYFLKKPIGEYLAKRSDLIASQLDEAAKLHKEAEAKLDQYQARLDAFDNERDKLFENVKREAEQDRAQIIADAKRQAERIRKDAEVAVSYEVKRAQSELRGRIVDEAVTIARQVLLEKLDKKTQDRLIGEYTTALSQLESDRAG